MGLFNFYLKEGPGIDPNTPEKKGIALFFEILWRKFFPLIKANFFYFITSLPFFLILLIFITPMFTNSFVAAENAADDFGRIFFDLFFSFIIFNIIGSGPSSAAYSYITGCFTKSRPVWVISDGFDKFKENFKHSILLAVIDIAVLIIFAIAINFYRESTASISFYMYFFVIVFLIFYMISHTFAYQVMVNFECKFKDVLKNAFILTSAKLPMCVLLSIICVALCLLIFSYLGLLGIVAYITIGMSITKFPLEFYTSRVIKKFIEENYKTEQ